MIYGVCGKSMTFDNKGNTTDVVSLCSSYIALNLCLNKGTSDDYNEFLQQQIGPYELGKNYSACWECLLRAAGFKPEKEEEK